MLRAPIRIAARLSLWLGLAAALGGAMAADDVPQAYVRTCDPAASPRRACLRAPVPAASPLVPGQPPVTARVDAQCWWNRTGVLLEPAGQYEVRVTQVLEPWRDNEMDESDLATGWTGPVASFVGAFARLFARDIHAPMYALVGARGQNPDDFVLLGKRASVSGVASGPVELLAFANDWRGMYRNNHGCLELTITRTR